MNSSSSTHATPTAHTPSIPAPSRWKVLIGFNHRSAAKGPCQTGAGLLSTVAVDSGPTHSTPLPPFPAPSLLLPSVQPAQPTPPAVALWSVLSDVLPFLLLLLPSPASLTSLCPGTGSCGPEPQCVPCPPVVRLLCWGRPGPGAERARGGHPGGGEMGLQIQAGHWPLLVTWPRAGVP